KPVRLDSGKVFPPLNDNFGYADFAGIQERFVEERIGLLSSFLRLEKVRFVKELWIDLRLFDEVGNLNRVSGFNFDLLEVLFFQGHPVTFLVLEPLDD